MIKIRIGISAFLIAFVGSTFAQEVKKTPSDVLPPLLKEIEKKYAEAGAIKADFVQVSFSALTRLEKKSSGSLWVKRPNKVRWDTQSSDPNLLVGNGKQFWFYRPPLDAEDRGQVVIRKASEVQSEAATALLSGRFSLLKGMRLEKKTETTFLFYPKKGTAGSVIKAEIEANPEKKWIEKVVLEHAGGNRATITLNHIELGVSIEDSAFEFKIPPKTDEIEPAKE